MGAIVDAISDVFEGVVDAVGDLVDGALDVVDQVMETVAENPILIVAAVAAPFALEALAAETATAGALEVAGAAEAVETGVAILEATETATAVASAETAAASTVIQGGATVAEATEAASLVSEGASVAEAVSSATAGAVETSTLTEVASTATEGLSSTWETLSQGAQSIVQTIGETLAPGADASLQKLAGQVAINTATNGGDFEKALVNTGISFGTGLLGSEIAGATGSDFAGRVAANAAKQLITTGDVDLTKMAGSEVGKFVGSEVADETGSDLAGKAASSITNSVIQGKDASTGLLGLGINEVVNQGADAVNDFVKSSGVDDSITAEDQSGITKTGTVEGGLNAVAENNQKNADELTGGLNQIINKDITSDTTKPTTLTGEQDGSRAIDDIVSGTSVDDAYNSPATSATSITEQPESITSGGLNQIAEVPAEATPYDALYDIGKEVPVQPETTNIPTTVEEKKDTGIAPVVGGTSMANKLTSLIKPQVSKTLTKALLPSAKPVVRQPNAQQIAAMKIAKTKATPPPTQMDVSKLIPINKTTAPKYTAPAKADVSKLTPIKNVAGLTSILKKSG